MKTLTIRNVPDPVYQELRDWARESHRSLQEQVRHLLEEEVTLRSTSCLETAQQIRQRLASRPFGDLVEDIREDRTR